MKKNPKKIILISIVIIILVFSLFPKNYSCAQLIQPENTNSGQIKEDILHETGKIAFSAGQNVEHATNFFALILQHSLNLAQNVKNIRTVKLGWEFSRDIANLGFVIFIIIIAFATILRQESYGIKQALVKLILIALLINFSFVITVWVIETSNFLTMVFLQNMPGLGDTIMNIIKPQSAILDVSNLTKASWLDKLLHPLQQALAFLTGLFWAIIFGIIALIVLAAMTIMFYLRTLAFIFLLMVAPIAWLGYIFPNLRKQTWELWWDQLLKWSFFAPIMAFFVRLAHLFVNVDKIYTDEQVIGSTAYQAIKEASFAGDAGNIMLRVFFSAGLLIGGLVIGYKTGITGSKITFGMGQKIGKWAMGMPGTIGKMAARPTLGKMAESMQKWGAGQKGIGRAITMPFRRLGAWTVSKGYGAKTSFAQIAAQKAKEMEKIPFEQMSYMGQTPAARLAMVQRAVKEGKVDKLPEYAWFEMEKLYRRAGLENELKKVYQQIPTRFSNVWTNLQKQDFAKAGEEFAQQLSKTPDWEKFNFGAVINGGPIAQGKITPEDYQDKFINQQLGKIIIENKAAGQKLGKVLPKLNTGQIEKLRESMHWYLEKTKGFLSPEEKSQYLKKNYPSLYHYLTTTPAGRAFRFPKIEESKESKKEEPRIIPGSKYGGL